MGFPTASGRYNLPGSQGSGTPAAAQRPQPVPLELGAVRTFMDDEQYAHLLRAVWRKAKFLTLPILATNAAGGAFAILPEQPDRCYLFVQNQSGVAQLIFNFGAPPGATGLIPANGIVIGAFPGFYEPLAVPTNEVWVAASAPATPGFLIYATNG